VQKIVIDTNVIISAFLTKGIPSKIISHLVLEQKVQICTSDPVWEEYINVVNREKFSRFPNFKSNAHFVLSFIREISFHVHPEQKVQILKDLDDNKFLELAHKVEADFIITGNTNDFTIETFGKTKIVSPSEYWQFHKPETD